MKGHRGTISFKRHARFRFQQRKIPEPWITDLLREIPYEPNGEQRLQIPGTKLVVVYEDKHGTRHVITAYADE